VGTPVSGPGQFSQRTDKAVSGANAALPNAQYGENKDYQEQKAAAPLASDSGTPIDVGALLGSMRPEAIGLDAESQQPDVPVTDGAALGPGAGPEVLGPQAEDPSASKNASWMYALMYMADQPNSSDSARNLIRQMKANGGM
jgi:hypothetical protein